MPFRAREDDGTLFNLDAIEASALHLMDALGKEVLGRSLPELGWRFGFDNARRRLGCCRWKRTATATLKHITLSRHYALQNGWAMMEDVARHEIAHAIDFELRGKSGHGPAWKRLALACGADPARLYEGEAPEPADSKYVGRCPACGTEQAYYRRIRRAHACPGCCRQHNGGRYAERFKLALFERSTGTPVSPAAPTVRRRKRRF